MLTTLIITKKMNNVHGIMQSDYLKLFYDVAEGTEGETVFHLNDFHKLG